MWLPDSVEVDSDLAKDCDHRLGKHVISSVAADAELEWDAELARTDRQYDNCVTAKLPSLKFEKRSCYRHCRPWFGT